MLSAATCSGCILFFLIVSNTPLMADGLHEPQISKFFTSTYLSPSFRINLCGLDAGFLTCLLSDQEQFLKQMITYLTATLTVTISHYIDRDIVPCRVMGFSGYGR